MITCAQQWDGLLVTRNREMRDAGTPACPMCKGVGSFNAFARTGRNRRVMCNCCQGTGNAPKSLRKEEN